MRNLGLIVVKKMWRIVLEHSKAIGILSQNSARKVVLDGMMI
jgi:hypothetical protein